MAEFTTTSTLKTTTTTRGIFINTATTLTTPVSPTKTYSGLTTPFVPPNPTCTNIFNTTVLTTSFWWNGDMHKISTLTVLVSDAGDPRFSRCMPAGWDPRVPETATQMFEFSPAVCPESWTMHYVRSVSPDLSTANCCAPGFKYHHPTDLPGIYYSMGCFSDPGATPSSNIWDYQTRFGKGTMVAHNAWRVSWASSDLSTMSPLPPPDLTRWAYDSWPTDDPSQITTGTAWPTPTGFDAPPPGHRSKSPSVVFIVLIILFAIFMISMSAYGVVEMRRRKRDKMAANIVEGRAMNGLDTHQRPPDGDPATVEGRGEGEAEGQEIQSVSAPTIAGAAQARTRGPGLPRYT
ncbi:hypothetical protein QBC43DRAFT_323957 [Cladorrhinum sp. PSN259]|nr:hypothetical protein QBC43DRAFT_323957 [Cladorrhinum sp. PSN259]